MTMAAHPSNPTSNEGTPSANNAGGAAPSPAPAPAAAAPVPPVAPTAAPVVPPTPPAPTGTPQTRKILSADDDSIPDDADGFEISKTAFKKRLERYSRTQLKQLFGTDNPEEIMAWKTQNEQYAAAQEEQRLAQLSEAERYKIQFEREQQSAAHWKQQFETLQESHALREQDRQMTAVAQKYVNPKCMNFLMMEFASHLQGADEKEIGEPQAYADSWFKSYVEANPEFGVPSQAAPPPAANPFPMGAPNNVNTNAGVPPAAPPRQVQVPITNGVSQGRPQNAVPTGQLAQKTLAPGLPNSMTDDEARAWKRQHGYNY